MLSNVGEVTPNVAPRTVIMQLVVPSPPEVRQSVFQRSHMGRSGLMHPSAGFANTESNVRSASDCHVNTSILIIDVVTNGMPLLLEPVSDVKIVLCDRSWSFKIFLMC